MKFILLSFCIFHFSGACAQNFDVPLVDPTTIVEEFTDHQLLYVVDSFIPNDPRPTLSSKIAYKSKKSALNAFIRQPLKIILSNTEGSHSTLDIYKLASPGNLRMYDWHQAGNYRQVARFVGMDESLIDVPANQYDAFRNLNLDLLTDWGLSAKNAVVILKLDKFQKLSLAEAVAALAQHPSPEQIKMTEILKELEACADDLKVTKAQ